MGLNAIRDWWWEGGAAEREASREVLRAVLVTAQAQSEATIAMADALRMLTAVTGAQRAPVSRALDDEAEWTAWQAKQAEGN